MRHALFVTLLLLPVLAHAPTAAAQSIPSPYQYVERAQSLTLQAGYLITDPGDLDLGVRSAPITALRYVGRFAGPAAGEVTVGFVPTERTVYGRTNVTSADAPLTPLRDTDAYLITAEAGLRFSLTGPRTWHGLQPSVGATAGLVADLARRTEEEGQLPANQLVRLGPAFAVGLSAGTDWFLTERLSIRLLAQDHLWRRRVPEGLTSSGAARTDWTHNLGLTLGAALHF